MLVLAAACSKSEVEVEDNGPLTPDPAASFQLDDLSKEIILRAPDGAAVVFQAGSLQTEGGGVPALPITVTLKSVLNADSGPEDMPGGFDGIDASGAQVTLISFGVVDVTLVDAAGNKVTLKTGMPATLTIPALVKGQAEIPLWWLDEGGDPVVWREEGSSRLQGNAYVGEVAHFSAWNVDLPCPGQKVCVEGDLEVCQSTATSISLTPLSELACGNWTPGTLTGGASKVSGNTFKILGLIPGTYNLRVMIDGAPYDQALVVPATSGCLDVGTLTFNCGGGGDAGPDATVDQSVADISVDLNSRDGPSVDTTADLSFDLGSPEMSIDSSSSDAVADAGFPLQGPLNGCISATCPGPTYINGYFNTTIDENGNLTGTASSGFINAVVTGTVNASGQINANSSGTALDCTWIGTITRVNGANFGEGTFSCANGCSGTWSSLC